MVTETITDDELEEAGEDGFPFVAGGYTETKTDCKYWGEVKHGFLTVPGCTKNYLRWCKFFCTNCKNYEPK
ncbi:MAG: hypothetical protein ACTSPI_00620 [Candidatus Heimdallarchaeaceae archaeon]